MSASLSIRFERLGRTGFVVTDRDRPHRTLTVYRDSQPAAFSALRELELDMASVTPTREQHLLGVIAAAWRARDAQRSPHWAGRDPELRPAA